MDVERWNRKDS